jgi:Zn-dependent protease with chaperone function
MQYEPRVPREGINVTPVHPLREAATLTLGIAGAMALLVAIAAFGVDLAVRAIPPDFEARRFEGLLAAADAAPPAPDGRDERARALLERLARRWRDAPYRFRLAVVPAAEANAAALPGGHVLVTRPLLDDAVSENEIAFVLGHELGHFHGRDHLRRLGRVVVYGLAFAAVFGQSGDPGDLGALSAELTSRGFDREQESAADAFGLDLVAAEYGHLAGAFDFFERMQRAGKGTRLAAYFGTHPAAGDRVAALRRLAAERSLSLTGEPLPFVSATPPRP